MIKNNNPIYYWTDCGCKLHEHNLKRHYNLRICSEHGGRIIKRTRACMDCEIEVDIGLSGRGKNRCQEHSKIYRKVTVTATNQAYYKKNKKENAWKVIKRKKEREEKRNAKKKINLKKPKKIKKVKKKTVVNNSVHKLGFSLNWRGDYCKNINSCLLKYKRLPCSTCKKFTGIFHKIDPIKLGLFTL